MFIALSVWCRRATSGGGHRISSPELVAAGQHRTVWVAGMRHCMWLLGLHALSLSLASVHPTHHTSNVCTHSPPWQNPPTSVPCTRSRTCLHVQRAWQQTARPLSCIPHLVRAGHGTGAPRQRSGHCGPQCWATHPARRHRLQPGTGAAEALEGVRLCAWAACSHQVAGLVQGGGCAAHAAGV